MRRWLWMLGAVLMLAGCGKQADFRFKDGDLLFQVTEGSEFSSAIHDATRRGEEVSFSHVGMISIEKDGIFVLEAEPKNGVHLTPLQDFLDDAARDEAGHPLVQVERIGDEILARRAVQEGKKYIGQPYDQTFLPDNRKMYCSELVYESFLDEEGHHLLRSKAMTFKNAEGNVSEYWVKLFGDLRMEIPEGVEGTNPNDMSHDPALYVVFRYYPSEF